ncbi:DNA polymerase III subunit beta [Clostridia bacterium]|nr:DNA polymerase III subunit beta [Clostridia bacterium]
MKFIANQNIIHDAVISAAKAAASKTAVNALDGVLLTLAGNKLTATGYDLETGIRISVDVEGIEDGGVVVDHRLFAEMLRRMPAQEITVTSDGKADVAMSAGSVKLSLMGKSADNYPDIVELNDSISLTMPQSLLKESVTQVLYAAASKEMFSPALLGVLFEQRDGVLFVVGSDGVRVALKKLPFDKEVKQFVVPRKTVEALIRNLDGPRTIAEYSGDSDTAGESAAPKKSSAKSQKNKENKSEDDDITIILDRNQISFSKKDYIIISRLLEGKYIDYQRVISVTYPNEIVINVADFAGCMNRCSILINEKFKSPAVMTIRGKKVNISCKTMLGNISEELEIRPVNQADPDKDFVVGVNPRYIHDAITNSGCDELRMEYSTAVGPIRFTPLEGDDAIFVVVPVRI